MKIDIIILNITLFIIAASLGLFDKIRDHHGHQPFELGCLVEAEGGRFREMVQWGALLRA
jgi:hypothetical protein